MPRWLAKVMPAPQLSSSPATEPLLKTGNHA
jgi:hypothetical protein